jgi:uncharacterized membrane protein
MQVDKVTSSKGATWALALAGGVLGGSIESSPFGFVVGALLGVLLAQVLHFRSRADALEHDLRALNARLSASERVPASAVAPAARAARIEPEKAEEPKIEPAVAEAPAPVRPAPELAPRPAPPARAVFQPAPAEPTFIDRAISDALAWLKRGNPLARIGIVILFFGASFLAKYAADHSLFPIELRFLALSVGAIVLLVIGWRLRERRSVYAQLLQGGGIAGLYLTVFAATRLYSLLPFGLCFGLLVATAITAAVLAVAQNSLSLAVIGTTGGFLAPIMVSTGGGNHVALFSYYAILNIGVFAVAWFRTWRVLNVIGFLFTFTITALWRVDGYERADLATADPFLILFFLMYVGVSILNCVRQPPDLKGYVSGSLVFGLPVVAFTLHASMVSRIEYAMAWSAFALGAFYLALGWALWRSGRETFRLLVEAFAALGVVFASLAIPLAFDTRTTAATWAVEGAGLLWLGVRQQRRLPRAFGTLLQLGAGVGFLWGANASLFTRPFLNSAYLGAVMIALAGVFSGYWLERNRERRASYEAGAQIAFTLWGVAWWSFAGLSEINWHFDRTALGAALAYIVVTVVLLAGLGIAKQWRLPKLIASYLPAIAAVCALVAAIPYQHPFAQWGGVGWLLLFGAHYWMLRRGEAEALPGVLPLHAGACWTLALVLAWESSWRVAEQTAGVWSELPWGVVPALIVAWLGRRSLVPSWPPERNADTYKTLGAAPLVIGIAVWILATNLTSTGDATWLPYLPLLNPLDVSVALCFAAAALWWTGLDEQQRLRLWPFDLRVAIGIVAALAFVWLNAALIRSLHHNWGAPITSYGIVRSTLVQAALSIFWGLLGFTAMTLAARQRWRYVWIVGAALMIVVVAKLFLVDLSKIGTVARIASFLTVGVLLLVTGYLAPLPPRRAGEHEPVQA